MGNAEYNVKKLDFENLVQKFLIRYKTFQSRMWSESFDRLMDVKVFKS